MSVTKSKNFQRVIDKDQSTDDVLVIRSDLCSSEECDEWLHMYSSETSTNWIVNYSLPNPDRLVLHKTWNCHHSSKNKSKLSSKSKSTSCKASIDIKIKKVNHGTKKNDKYLKEDPPLPAIFRIKLQHNHNTESADALRYLPVSESTKNQLLEYFNEGLSASAAKRLHESKLVIVKNGNVALADGSVNPTQSSVSYMYQKWREHNFGSTIDPLVKIKERIEMYESEGVLVRVREDPNWAVLVVTAVMQRAQMLSSSSEIIFCDSSSSCDAAQSTITILLTATAGGAVPIAVLIHHSQTTDAYRTAFELLKEHCPNAFGGNNVPSVFMTDDSKAEKLALKSVWPSAKQLLCFFHVGQAEWRWLMSSASGVPSDSRRELMSLFRKVMYADTAEKLETAVEDIHTVENEKFVERFDKFLERQEEWVLLHRVNSLTRGHNTNNYAEATIRILKDVILTRTRAFNAAALLDFCVSVWEEYYVTKLLDFAHNRRSKPRLAFSELCERGHGVNTEDIRRVDENTYSVPSFTSAGVTYTVDVDIAVCSCRSGCQGGFCKHMAAVHNKFEVVFANAPAVNSSSRYSLAQLALGDEYPPLSFFLGLQEDLPSVTLDDTARHATAAPSAAESASDNPPKFPLPAADHSQEDISSAEFTDAVGNLEAEIIRVRGFLTDNSHSLKLIKLLTGVLSKVNSESQLSEVMSGISRRKFSGRISVQPTSIARRRDGVTKGCKRIASGRPPKMPARKVPRKRLHKLHESIAANVANAKSHGSGH